MIIQFPTREQRQRREFRRDYKPEDPAIKKEEKIQRCLAQNERRQHAKSNPY